MSKTKPKALNTDGFEHRGVRFHINHCGNTFMYALSGYQEMKILKYCKDWKDAVKKVERIITERTQL